MLDALGDGAAERGTAVNQTLRVIKMVNDCGVEIIILDEFQHFIDSDSKIILDSVSNWLKDLINETKKPKGGHVNITGVGLAGIGKTALAFHVARLLQSDYPDGQILIHLSDSAESISAGLREAVQA